MTLVVQSVAAFERGTPAEAGRSKRRIPPAVLDALLARQSLSADAKVLYLAFYRIGHHRRTKWPKQAELAAALGVSERHVRRYVAELREDGLLDSWKGAHTKPNVYRLVHPDEWPAITAGRERERQGTSKAACFGRDKAGSSTAERSATAAPSLPLSAVAEAQREATA
jgi:hypothetical protein